MYTWLVEQIWSLRRSQHRDHTATLGGRDFGVVNSADETWREVRVIAQSKFRMKQANKF